MECLHDMEVDCEYIIIKRNIENLLVESLVQTHCLVTASLAIEEFIFCLSNICSVPACSWAEKVMGCVFEGTATQSIFHYLAAG